MVIVFVVYSIRKLWGKWGYFKDADLIIYKSYNLQTKYLHEKTTKNLPSNQCHHHRTWP